MSCKYLALVVPFRTVLCQIVTILKVYFPKEVAVSSTGHVILLEEDNMVSPDFLHILSLVESERVRNYSYCEVISLGGHTKAKFERFGRSVSC